MAQHVRLSAHGMLVVLLASLFVALTGTASEAADRDCPSFASQRGAQLFFLRHGGPRRDPHRLDDDADGIACETRPAPYYFRKRLPDAGPPAAVRSTVRLSARPKAGINGERLVLRVSVKPRTSRTVVLQRKTSARWRLLDTARTTGRGRLTHRTSIGRSTTRYRAVLRAERIGGRRYSADVSLPKRVRTQQQSVTLSMPNGAVTGTAVEAVVEVRPVRQGRRVHLQTRTRRGWETVDRGRESRRGLVRLKDRRLSEGRHKYRAVVLAAGGADEVRSNRERVVATTPEPDDTTPPATPSGLSASPGNGVVDLSWNEVSDLDLDEYVVYRFGGAAWVEVGRTVAETFSVAGLTNDVTYTFAVSAVDLAGNESSRSPSTTATPVAPDTTPPAVPAGLRADPGNEAVTLTWDAVSAPDLARYRVHVRESGTTEWTRVETVTGGPTHTVRGLTNLTSYDFAVSAVDLVGNESARSDVVSASPPPLEVPVGLSADPGDGTVLLDWSDATDPRVIGYRVEVRDSVDDPWRPARDGVTLDSVEIVSGLDNGVPYFFSVVALSADGAESNRSDVVAATPAAPAR